MGRDVDLLRIVGLDADPSLVTGDKISTLTPARRDPRPAGELQLAFRGDARWQVIERIGDVVLGLLGSLWPEFMHVSVFPRTGFGIYRLNTPAASTRSTARSSQSTVT